jgi:chaperone modulatory protein CbpM
MTEKSALNSEIIDADVMCTLDELCLACNVEADWIAELVEHGIIEPVGQARSDWQFAMVSVVRAAKAKRLERDLALNLPGLALALDLLDEIDDLRSKLKLNQQPK